MDENQFHLQDHEHTPNHDDTAEALIASLKAVINDPNSHNQQPSDVHDHETDPESSQQPQHHEQAQNTLSAFTAEHHINPVHVGLRKSLAQLTHLTNAHQGLLDELNGAGAIQNLAQNLKALKEGNKRQIDVLKELTAQIKASELGVDLSVPCQYQYHLRIPPVYSADAERKFPSNSILNYPPWFYGLTTTLSKLNTMPCWYLDPRLLLPQVNDRLLLADRELPNRLPQSPLLNLRHFVQSKKTNVDPIVAPPQEVLKGERKDPLGLK